MQEYVMKWLLATQMKSRHSKKDTEAGVVIPEYQPHRLSLIPAHGRSYK